MADSNRAPSIPIVFGSIFMAFTALGGKDPTGTTKTIEFWRSWRGDNCLALPVVELLVVQSVDRSVYRLFQ